jgi:hypothetical protein
MNALPKISSLIVLCWAMNVTYAQQPAPSPAPAGTPATADTPVPAPAAKPPKGTQQSEAGEPRANTSRTTTPQSEAGEPRASTTRPATPQSEAGEPRANTSSKPAAVAGGRANPAAGQKAPGSADRLELGTATVTGDREQPKVMYIVPWKKSDIGDLAGKPMNSLVDEILAPVDRDVFKREVVYYKAVQADTSQNGAPGHPSDQGEK